MTNYALLLFTSICWGSWAVPLKFTKDYRQNFFYLDYTVVSLLLAFLLWSFSPNSFADLVTPNTFLPIAGGVLFAFGNLLLVKSIDRYGFSLSFPAIIGGAVIIGGLLNFVRSPLNSSWLFLSGLAVIVLAIVVNSYLYKLGSTNPSEKTAFERKGLLGLIFGALFIGIFPLFWNFGLEVFNIQELFLILLVGHFLGVLIVSIFTKYLTFSHLKKYLRSTPKNHLISSTGAAIWVTGTYLNMVVGSRVGFGVSFVIGNIAPLFSTMWGVFYWKELSLKKPKAKTAFLLMVILFLTGLVFIANS